MRIGSLFAGVGGLELGLEWAGVGHTVWQVEQDEYCRRVLERHWPDAERFTDVREVGAATLAPVDLICGGSPCQDLSSAGRREGLSGSLSGLWFEFARIVDELRPSWVVAENVPNGEWIDTACCQLAGGGYEPFPVPLSAADVGAPHVRERIFIVARNTDQDSKSVVPINEEVGELPSAAERFSGWSERPDLLLAPGVSSGMGAYGNSVVPTDAEVIGWIIRELENGDH